MDTSAHVKGEHIVTGRMALSIGNLTDTSKLKSYSGFCGAKLLKLGWNIGSPAE
jgi:hypothetical protein